MTQVRKFVQQTCLVAILLSVTLIGNAHGHKEKDDKDKMSAMANDPEMNADANIYIDRTIQGDLQVPDGDELIMYGVNEVFGNVEAKSASNVQLLGQLTVHGNIIIKNVEDIVVIGPEVTAKDLIMEDIGSSFVEGTFDSLEIKRSGRVVLEGASIGLGGITTKNVVGDIVMCNTIIEGYAWVQQLQGNFVNLSSNCNATEIHQEIWIKEVTGSVILGNMKEGAAASKEVMISDVSGDVSLEGIKTKYLDVDHVSKELHVSRVRAEKDAVVSAIEGDCFLHEISAENKLKISNLKKVHLTNSDAGAGSGGIIEIEDVSQSLEVSNNTSGELIVSKCNNIIATKNNLDSLQLSDGEGTISVSDNVITSMYCNKMKSKIGFNDNSLPILPRECE